MVLAIIANEEAEASLEGGPDGPLSAQSVQGGREKKKPKPPSSKAKKIHITVSLLSKKRATVDRNKPKASAEEPQGQG